MAEPPPDAQGLPAEPEPAPRKAPRSKLGALKEPAQVPPNVDALMKVVARVLAASISRGVPPETEAPLHQAGRKGRRFQRVSTLEKHLPAVAAVPGDQPPANTAKTADTRLERAAGSFQRVRSARRIYPASGRAKAGLRLAAAFAAWRRHPFFVWVAVQIFCLGLILLGVLLGSLGSGTSSPPAANSARQNEPNPAATVAATPARVATDGSQEKTLPTADLVVAKENAGDFPAAQNLLESMGSSAAQPGMEYQLAWLALRRHDRANAGLHLERSIVANEAVAPCCYLRAAFAGARGDYREASAELRLAAQAEPFNARYFFYWGECLRRNGQLPEAAACLEQALARPHSASDEALYRFKLRLTHLADGSGKLLLAELEDKLRQIPPPGDWLLLAAAQNIQRGAFTAAAEFLRRAAIVLPPETFRLWVQDYAFQNYPGQLQLAPALPNAPPAPPESLPSATALPPDPTVCTPAEGDPALWRSVAAHA